MRDSNTNQLLHQQDPDIVSCNSRGQNSTSGIQRAGISSETGGFDVEGDKTKFATLQRQRKQIYDEIRDSKCRVQQLRRNLLSPSQFEGSAEKLLVNNADMNVDGNGHGSQNFYSTFGTSSGRASPCTTPTPPPYNRNRSTNSGQTTVSPQVSSS